MEPYICPYCGKVYAVTPKACTCEDVGMPDIEPTVEYALKGNGVVSLSKEEYDALLKFGKVRPKDSGFELMKITSRTGIETADVSHEIIYLTEDEFRACQAWLKKKRD